MTSGEGTADLITCAVRYPKAQRIHLKHDPYDDRDLHATGPAAPDSAVLVHGYEPEIAFTEKWIIIS